MINRQAAVIVVGGGSAGTAAAIEASRHGAKTMLIEAENMLGGTSTVCGVNCWEPVCGAIGIPQEFYERMSRYPLGTGIYSIRRHICRPNGLNHYPGSENPLLSGFTYKDTLKNTWDYAAPIDFVHWHGVIFEPEIWHRTALQWLQETKHCQILLNTRVTEVIAEHGLIRALRLSDGSMAAANIFIDACGAVAQAAGCPFFVGQDPRALYDEPDAPDKPTARLNGVTRIFRISPTDHPAVEPCQCPSYIKNYAYMVGTTYPNGDINCNMLPTMSGEEYMHLGPQAADAECIRRVHGYWRWLQENYSEFQNYRLTHIFPKTGIRESIRVKCRFMLTQNDIVSRRHFPDAITTADHKLDLHGLGNPKHQVTGPYDIPYRCLLPEGIDNLLVAGRIAGFSAIAASSCRLARTMMQLGQAAGLAAAITQSHHCLPSEIDTGELRSQLNM